MWIFLKLFWFFDISLLYYYFNLESSIISFLFSGDMSLSDSFVTVSELCCCEFFETFVILPSYDLATATAVLLPIKSPVASAAFWIALFEAVLKASVADCLAWSRSFWLYLPLKFLLK